MKLDRELIADVVERQLFLHPDLRGNWSALERKSRVSHSTMSRIKRADPRVTPTTFRKIEVALGLPFDTLFTVAIHDIDGLDELGVPDNMAPWLRNLITTAAAGRKSG
jgi:transcriptional regulator with XRE-family HTH domain